MKLVFVRHGDPDYVHDSLTERGKVEAEILSGRIAELKVRKFYCSPLGRAEETAKYTLEKIGKNAITCDWLREFPGYIIDEKTGGRRIPWDFMPRDWTGKPKLYDREKWLLEPVMQTGDVEEVYARVCAGIDGLLSEYGYIPVMLWQGFFVAPTSVTTLVTEERIPGEVFFRCTGFGDISHLYKAGLEPSKSGFFEEMQGR